ncbi:MAG: helix-turn-helix domain-containing protein [Clostridia bacterium]|nr:helix-turn-helix domain-containing protein [Clostridia bacterium]MBQ9314975.1 helix-turn-helix domain-containing protein [Clostridia bacterium]
MIYVRVNEILKEKKKTKYWFIKNMEGGYQSLSHLMDNTTTGIKFETLEKMCKILECEPGDIIVRKKSIRKKVKKDEQTSKAV